MSPEQFVAASLRALRKTIRSVIPETFGWWFEMDHDIAVSIRWIWLGHPGVTHCGAVSDSSIEILVALLRCVDWDAEVSAAIQSVEATEIRLLQAAQVRRRLKLTDRAFLSSLPEPETEPADLVPADFAAKRRDVGPFQIPEKRVKVDEFALRLAMIPPEPERPAEPAGKTTMITHYHHVGAYLLCRTRGAFKSAKWEAFDSLEELYDAIRANDPFTWYQACLFGVQMQGYVLVNRLVNREVMPLPRKVRNQQKRRASMLAALERRKALNA